MGRDSRMGLVAIVVGALALAGCGKEKRDAGIGDSIQVSGGALDTPPDTSALRETPGAPPLPKGVTGGFARAPLSPSYYPPAAYPPAYPPPSHSPPSRSTNSPPPQFEPLPSYSAPAPATQPARPTQLPPSRSTSTEAQRIPIPAESLRVAPRPTGESATRDTTPSPAASRTTQPAAAPPAPATPPRDTTTRRADTTRIPR